MPSNLIAATGLVPCGRIRVRLRADASGLRSQGLQRQLSLDDRLPWTRVHPLWLHRRAQLG